MKTAIPRSARPNPAGDKPKVDPTAYIDPTAQVIGKVRIGARTFVGPTAVIRADEAGKHGQIQPVFIGRDCNVQDGAIVHALKGTRVVIGSRTALAHGAIVHGPAELGAGCFVGFRAVVFNATLGDGVYVGSGAIIQNVRIEANTLVPAGCAVLSQDQADGLGRTGAAERTFIRAVVNSNVRLALGYLRLDARLKRKGQV